MSGLRSKTERRWTAWARRIVRVAARLVPARQRPQWQREWEAEIEAWNRRRQQGDWRSAWVLLRRCALSPLDALAFRRELCRRPLGNIPSAEIAGPSWLAGLNRDARLSLRDLRRRPATAAVLLITLAVGIGGSTAVFSVLHGVVLSPLPYPDSQDIVQVWPARSKSMSKELLVRLQEEARSYQWLAAWSEDAFKLAQDGRAEMVYGPAVSADFFRVLGARSAAGRIFAPGEDRGGPPLAMLTHHFWQEHYGGDPTVVGQHIELSQTSYQIIGVLEPGFELLQHGRADLVISHRVVADDVDYHDYYLDVTGRLRPGVSVAQADAELRRLATRWAEEKGASPQWAASASVVSLHEHMVGDLRLPMLLLFAAMGCIVLIIVANVANLLLARVLARQHELRVRFALGASHWRVMRQLLTEATMIAALGGLLGAAVAGLALDTLVALLPRDLPRLDAVRVEPEVMLFALGLTLAVGLLVGLSPALSGARSELRSSQRTSTGSRHRHRLRATLVVAEVTLAMVLLAGAGVLLKSFWRTLQVDPGFEPAGLVHFMVLPGQQKWSSAAQLDDYYRQLEQKLSTLAGIEDVATVHAVPVVDGGWVMPTYPSLNPPGAQERRPFARWRPVSDNYFHTARIQPLAGRLFAPTDLENSEPVTILNATAARAFFGGTQEALGQQVRIDFEGPQDLRVVGVVADVKILGLRAAAPNTAYRPFRQAGVALRRIEVINRSLVLRARLPVSTLAAPLQELLEQHDPMISMINLQSMENALAASLARPRVMAMLLTSFAALALLLGALGLYGMMGYAVRERQREIGIRMALGASVGSVLRRVMALGLLLTTLGLLLGGGLAVVLTHLLGQQLFEVSPKDPATFLAVGAVLLASALIATYLPARRAGRVDPVQVLQAD